MNVDREELLTIAYVQRVTGESESCWRRRLARRELSYIRLGGNVRIRRAVFERWLTERTVVADQLTKEAPHG